MWFAFVVVVMIVAFALVFKSAAKQEADRARIWRSFADSRGLSLVTKDYGIASQSSIEGAIEDIKVTVDSFTKRSNDDDDKRSQTYTRVVASSRRGLPLDAHVYGEHVFSGLGKMLGFQDVETGDSTFDGTFVVKADSEQTVLELLDEDLRRALVGAGSAIQFKYEQGVVTLTWRGLELDVAVLDARVDLAVMAARSTGGERVEDAPPKKKKRRSRPRTERAE